MAKSTRSTTTKKVSTKKVPVVHQPIEKVLISQPKPTSDKSPYYDLAKKYNLELNFHQFIKVEGVSVKEFRKNGIDLAQYMGVIMLSRNSVDHFFRICEELKFKVSPDMRYFCTTEAVALYLQKFIQYRKRKVFFSADGTPEGLIDVLAKFKDKEQFIMPVSEFTKNEITPLLKSHDVKFIESVMYRTVSNDLNNYNPNDYDLIIMFSPFGVEAVMNDWPEVKKKKIRVATFGATTTEAAKVAGMNVVIEAPTPQAPSMVTALDLYIKSISNNK